MKSVRSKSCCKPEPKPYPKLMINDIGTNIYLMSEARVGVRIESSINDNAVGKHFTGLSMMFMLDYDGDVCLTND